MSIQHDLIKRKLFIKNKKILICLFHKLLFLKVLYYEISRKLKYLKSLKINQKTIKIEG